MNKKLDVNIDFDAAEKAWRSNKISLGNGVFRYIKTKNNKSTQNLHNYNLRPLPHRTRTKTSANHCYNLRPRN